MDILAFKAIGFFAITVLNFLMALLLWRKGKTKATLL